jgi:SPP1 gp7 family putative phage head morphogenesis protein
LKRGSTPIALRASPGAGGLSQVGRAVEARDAQFQRVADIFVPLSTSYFAAQQERLLGLLDQAPGHELDRLVAGDTPSHLVDWLTAAQIHGAGLALLHASEDVGSLRLAGIDDFVQALTPATASDFWASLLGVSKDFFTSLSDEARRISFAVAGLSEGPLLVDLHGILQQAQAGGLDRATAADLIRQAYESHGLVPTSDAHAQLVYANNTRQAAAAVRYQQTVDNPAAQRLLPYLMWWTIGDDRVRERPDHNHAVMHGKVFAVNHPIWQTWWNPAGHNCRCGIATINIADARRRGYVGSEPTGAWPSAPGSGAKALPDPGFRGSPDLSLAADDLTSKAQTIYDRASSEGGDLLAAVARLWSALGLSEGA